MICGASRVCPTAGGCSSAGGGDENYAEVRTNGKGPVEHGENDVGSGAGGYVVVAWLVAKEQVADAAAGKVGFVAGLAQVLHDLESRIEGAICGQRGHVLRVIRLRVGLGLDRLEVCPVQD